MSKLLSTYFRPLATVLTLLVAVGNIHAQHEIGAFGGGAQFLGDVGRSDIHMPEKFVGGILYRHNYNHHFSMRFMLSHGEITASDSTSSLPERQRRNLEFWSEVYEASMWLEFNFFPYKIGDPKLHSFFVFAGISAVHYNPRAMYNGERVELQGLRTEGQGTYLNPDVDPYKKYTVALPFGFGYKFNLGRKVGVGAEMGFRRTYSDYLDDVSTIYVNQQELANEAGLLSAELSNRSKTGLDYSGYQRGNSQNKDWFVFTGITITFKIFDVPEKCHDFSF